MRRSFILVAACASTIALAGCSTGPNGQPTISIPSIPSIDPSTVQQAQTLATQICGFLPAAETVASIIGTLAGAGPIVDIASQAANGICKAVTAKGARRGITPSFNGVTIKGNFVRR